MIFRWKLRRTSWCFLLLCTIIILLLKGRYTKKFLFKSNPNSIDQDCRGLGSPVQDSNLNAQAFENLDQKTSQCNLNYLNLNDNLDKETMMENDQDSTIYPTRKRKSTQNIYKNSTKISALLNQSEPIHNTYVDRLMKKSRTLRQWDPVALVREWKHYIYQKLAESDSRLEDSGLIPYSNEYSSSLKSKYLIPKVIWTYWPDGEGRYPPILQDCIFSWRRYNPDHTIIVLSRDMIEKVLDFSLPVQFDSLSYQHQKDWVKLAILLQEGGTWIDPSFIMTRSISFVEQILRASDEKRDGLMFFMDYYTFYPKFPFFDGYFISVVGGSKLIARWFLEWSFCIEEFQASVKYLDYLISTFGSYETENMIQGMPYEHQIEYLSLISLQKLIQIENVTPLLGLSSFNYPYGPMYLHEDVDGFSWDLIDNLLGYWNPQNLKLPAFLYLRPMDLTLLEFQVSQGWSWFKKYGVWNVFFKLHHRVHRGSFYCIYIKGQDLGCGGKVY